MSGISGLETGAARLLYEVTWTNPCRKFCAPNKTGTHVCLQVLDACSLQIFSLPNFSVLPVEITNQSLFQWQLLCSAWSHESQPCKNKLRFTAAAAKKAAKSPQSQHVRCGVISNVVLMLTVWIFFSQKACISPRTYIMLP